MHIRRSLCPILGFTYTYIGGIQANDGPATYGLLIAGVWTWSTPLVGGASSWPEDHIAC